MSVVSCRRDMPIETPPAEIPATEIPPTEILAPAPPEPAPFVPSNEAGVSNNDDYPNAYVAIDVPFPGRIAIVTNTVDSGGEIYFRPAEALVGRYGPERAENRDQSPPIARRVASPPRSGLVQSRKWGVKNYVA